jgi:streptomycin 6-kinase
VPHEAAEERDAAPFAMAFAGHGGVEVFGVDQAGGALLMPLLRPGTNLAESGLDELASSEVCARLIMGLRNAPSVAAKPLGEWFETLLTKRSEDELTCAAQEVAVELLNSQPPPVLLHGDLHHFNILRSGSSWVAIDPKGLSGDPAFEVAAFMRNPLPQPPGAEVMAERLRTFAQMLGDPIERLWGWSFVETVNCVGDCSGPIEAAWTAAAEALLSLKSEFWRS